ncbi:hypothetical protein ACF0H5_006565 [Mactra antiquata]
MTILEALQAEHPVARLVFQAIQNCHTVTKDGSKLFLLYLRNILVNIQQDILQGSFSHNGTNLKLINTSQQEASTLCVRKHIEHLKREILPRIYKQVIAHCELVRRQLRLDRIVCQQGVIKNILKTAMMPHYSVVQCDFYADLLVSCLPIDDVYRNMSEALQLTVDNFDHLVIKVPNHPYKDCAVLPMFLIKQRFKYKWEKLKARKQLKAVVLNCSCFVSESDEVSDTVKITESIGIEKLIVCQRSVVEKFVRSLEHNNIDIILCSCTLPNYVVDIFRRNRVSVISNVLEDDIELMELVSNKLNINNLSEDIDDVNIIKLSDVNEIIIGGREYIQLKFEDHTKSLKHLIVCAPTVGLCDQLALTLHKALNALKLSFLPIDEFNDNHFNRSEYLQNMGDLDTRKLSIEDHGCDVIKTTKIFPQVAYLIPDREVSDTVLTDTDTDDIWQNIAAIEGGTSFEILLAHLLKKYSVDCIDTNLSNLCDILEKAMLSVVQKLYENTNIEPKNKRNFLKIETLLKTKVCSDSLWGLDRRGLPCYLLDKGVLEPMFVKFHTLNCVLDLLYQLLGINKIVSCKKIKDD